VTLRAGYSANADVVIREKTDIVLIPERLVLFEDDATFVEIPGVGPDAEPQKIVVELGLSDGLNVEIVSGVAAGDQVVQRPPFEFSMMNFEFPPAPPADCEDTWRSIQNSEFRIQNPGGKVRA
jgi:multidrug efflux pump subunit AcrA (membrane-fusion protein)